MADKVINVEVKTDVSGVKNLKTELRETVEQLQKMPAGTEEFNRLTLKAAELKDKMADVNEQINVFASGSKYERVSNSLGEIGSAIANLDFEKAQDRAGAFAKAAGSITFGDAITSLKQLGSTFITLGKTLLSNPLFLLAAVIVGVIAAVYKLLDSLGVIKKMFDAIDKVIGIVISSLKVFTDWLGISDFAAQDLAENQIKRNEDIIASEQKKTNDIVGALDFEIRKRQANGEDTADIEKERLRVIQEAAREELKSRLRIAAATALLYEKDSEEFKKAMENIEAAKQAFIKASQDVEIADITFKKREIDRLKAAGQKKADERQKQIDAEAKQMEELRLLRLRQEQDLMAQIEALENEFFNSKLDKEQQEINAVRDKYFAVIEMAREAAEQMKASATTEDEKAAAEEMIARAATLEEAQQQAILDIQKRYQEERDALRQQEDANIQESNNERLKWAEMSWEQQTQMVASYVGQAGQFMNSIASLQQTNLDNQIKGAEGNEKKQEQLRKKAFEQNKKMQIAQAVINTAQAVIAAMSAGPIVGTIMAVLAAATGAASIAKIASTTYQGGGGASSVSAPNMAQAASSASMPSFNMFGTGGNTTQQAGSQSVESNITVQAVVSESDVTETQGKVNKYQQNAEL